jgi:hypothetical protein
MTAEDVQPVNNRTVKAKERIIIDICYYDELGMAVRIEDNPVRMDVSIRNSIYLQETTEDYSAKEPFGEAAKYEVETNGVIVSEKDIIYTTKVEKECYDKLTSILIDKLTGEIKSLALKIESETKSIEITERLAEFILSHFENIYLALPGLAAWVPLPPIDAVIKTLYIDSAQLLVNKTIITCKESFTLKGCILQASNEANNTPLLIVTAGKEASLSALKITSRLFIKVNTGYNTALNEWKKTSITAADIIIGFKDIERDSESYNGNHDALVTLAEANEVRISDVKNLNDIPYYPLLSLENINEVNITNLVRVSNALPAAASAVKLNNFSRFNLSGAQYIGVNESLEQVSFIQLSGVRPDSALSLSDIVIYKTNLMNLSGITCLKISISNSSFEDSKVFYNMENSSVGRLSLNTVSVKGAALSLKALSISILSSTSLESEDEITLRASESANLTGADIKANNAVRVILEKEASFIVKKSRIRAAKEFSIKTNYEAEEDNSSRVSLSESSLASRKQSFEGISSLNFQDLSLSASAFTVKKCQSCTLGILARYQKSPLEVIIEDSRLRLSDYYIYEAGANQAMNIKNCEGTLNVQYNDDETPLSIFRLSLEKSPVTLNFFAVSNRKVLFKCKESLGAQIIGNGELITLSPDLDSPDRLYFERFDGEVKRNVKKIQYGNKE